MVEVDMSLGTLPADKYEDVKAADQARVAVRIKLRDLLMRPGYCIFVYICHFHGNEHCEGPLISYVA